MSAIDRLRKLRLFTRRAPVLAAIGAIGVASIALAADVAGPDEAKVTGLLKARLPKTEVSKVN
ncbi:hypothetical protein QOZ23_32890, partial [Pseudomonas aeruginosa]